MATQIELQRIPRRQPPARSAARGRRWDVAAVAGPALLAVVLCLYELATRSLWLDEAATVAIAGQHGAALWSAIAHDGGNMLGYYALLHVLIGWFGDGALVIRLPSALAAGVCAGAVGLLGLRLFDRRVAAAAGLLSAVSLPLVFWGQDARGYGAMVALVAASFLAFAVLVQSGGRRAWIAYVALTTLSVYASFIAIVALPAQLVALAWRRHGWRRVGSALAVCAVAWVPLAVLALERGSGQLFWIPRPSLKLEGQVIQTLSSAGFEPNFRPTWAATGLTVATVALLVVAAVAIIRRPRWGPVLVLSWVLVPVILMWLWSLVGQPLFTPRNALVSLPAVALLLGWLLASSRSASVALVALAVLIALRVAALAPSYGVSPEPWRAATAYVLGASRPGDCYTFYPLDAQMPFAYYAGQRVRPYVERYETPRVPAGCGRVWLVASHQGLPSGTAASRAHYAKYLSVRRGLTHAYGRAATTRFGYASVIWVQLFAR